MQPPGNTVDGVCLNIRICRTNDSTLPQRIIYLGTSDEHWPRDYLVLYLFVSCRCLCVHVVYPGLLDCGADVRRRHSAGILDFVLVHPAGLRRGAKFLLH